MGCMLNPAGVDCYRTRAAGVKKGIGRFRWVRTSPSKPSPGRKSPHVGIEILRCGADRGTVSNGLGLEYKNLWIGDHHRWFFWDRHCLHSHAGNGRIDRSPLQSFSVDFRRNSAKWTRGPSINRPLAPGGSRCGRGLGRGSCADEKRGSRSFNQQCRIWPIWGFRLART